MSSADLRDKFGQNVGKKFLKDQITTIMNHNHVPIDLQKMIIFAVDNSIEYVDLCIKLNKKPDDPKVLTEFLINKGVFTAKLASDDIKCAVSLIELANGLRKNIPKARGPVPAAIVVSLTLLGSLIDRNLDLLSQVFRLRVLHAGSNCRERLLRPAWI